MAVSAAAPVLVYDRIAANRRATWLLLAVSAVLLLPLTLPAVEYLGLWAIVLLGLSFAAAMTAGALALLVILTLEYFYATQLVLRAARARPLAPGELDPTRRIVENLAIGCGVPEPKIYLIETPALNALSVGLNPKRGALVMTRGLVAQLDRRELEAVVAHELSHIGNHDTRLGTLLAAVVATLWLPARIVQRIFGVFFFIHPGLWMAALLWCGFQLELLVDSGFSLVLDAFTKGEWFWLPLMGASFYFVFGSPCLAILLRRAVWRQRELLADADAVLLTRHPAALQQVLEKMAPQSGLKVNPATAHLYMADPLAGSTTLSDRLFSAHPAMSERIALVQRMGPGVVSEGTAAKNVRPPVAVSEILLGVEAWPRKVCAALVLLLLPQPGHVGRLWILAGDVSPGADARCSFLPSARRPVASFPRAPRPVACRSSFHCAAERDRGWRPGEIPGGAARPRPIAAFYVQFRCPPFE